MSTKFVAADLREGILRAKFVHAVLREGILSTKFIAAECWQAVVGLGQHFPDLREGISGSLCIPVNFLSYFLKIVKTQSQFSSSRFHSKNELRFAYNSPAACFSSSLKFAFSSSASVSSEERVCESAV